MRVKYRFELPSDTLEAFYMDRSNACFIRGPLGSGKTQTVIMKLLAMTHDQPPNAAKIRPTRLIVVRNTYPDLTATTIRDWEAITGDIAPVKRSHPPQQALEFAIADGTTVRCDVIFIALDRADHVRKLRGLQATIAWLNESKELPYSIVEMIDARLGRYPSRALAGVDCVHSGKIVGDTNAPDDDHWYANMERNPPDGWRFVVQPGAVVREGLKWRVNHDAENIGNLPPGYYEKLLNGKRREWIKVNLANEFGTSVDGKQIQDEFSPDIHVREFDVEPDVSVLIGADWGLTPAIALAQEVDGRLRVFDEIITENMSAVQAADALKLRLATAWPGLRYGHGWGDPGAGRAQTDKNTPFNVFGAAGFTIFPTHTNDFTIRRDAVGAMLSRLVSGEPALTIHRRCTVLRKGLAGHYQFRRIAVAGDDRFHDVPDKNMYSHICEALQYLCVGMGEALKLVSSNDDDIPINFSRDKRGDHPISVLRRGS